MRRPLVSLGVLETPQTSTSAVVQRFYPAARHMEHNNNYDDAITPRSSEETHTLVTNSNSLIDLKNGLTTMKPCLVVETYPTILG